MYAPLSADLWRSPATPVYVAFVTFIRQIALVTRFSGQYEPFCSAFYVFCGVFIFLQCVLLLFAVCISFFSAFYVFLRCVCLVALHFTVFSVLLTIFFCVPRSFSGAGTGTTRRRNIFYIFFADLLTNKRVN